MGQRTNGGILGVANIPTTSQAGGVWTLKEVALYKKAGLWPAAATFALSVDSASVNKGGSFTVTLNTTGVSDGTLVPYTITGIASGDLSSGSLTGNFTVTSNTGSLTFTTASSGGTSGNLTATVTCGGQTTNIAIQEGDTYFKYVTALLHGDGTNAANNNTFTDSSSNNFTITRNGDTTQGTFTPFGDTWSNYFNGANSDVIEFANNAAFDFGTSDVTIEGWLYLTSVGSILNLMDAGPSSGTGFTSWTLSVDASGYLNFGSYVSGTNQSVSATNNALAANQWYHIAFTRASGTNRIFVNGVSCTLSGTFTQAINTGGNTLTIGRGKYTGYTRPMTGYLSNVRITKGGALYTSGFTPSTSNLTTTVSAGTVSLLTCQSNRFIDNSSNAFAVTPSGSPSVQKFAPFSPTAAYSTSGLGGSAYFDGSGDYLTAPSTSGQLGSGVFTIEAWIYPISRATTFPTIWNNYTSYGAGSLAIFAGHNSGTTTKYQLAINGAGFPVIQSTDSIIYNQWTHIAVVRNSSNVITLYINGVANGTYTTSATLNGTTGASWIGTAGDDTANGTFNGYISGMRVVAGTAVYTSAFTPPTAPLTAITNTKLLCNFTNGGIIDNAMMNDWITVGDVQVNTTTKKYGTGSIKFDGTGDCLTALDNPNLAYGTGDFTVEFWVYPTSNPSNQVFVDQRETTPAGAGFSLECGSDLKPVVATSVAVITSSTAMTANTWQHIAYSRSGTSLKLFLNGTQVGSATNSSNLTSQRITLGAYTSRATSFAFGYIDDLRITKGYARYTSNFTAPTGPAQDR